MRPPAAHAAGAAAAAVDTAMLRASAAPHVPALDSHVGSSLLPEANLHDDAGLVCGTAGSGSDACSVLAGAGCRSRLGLRAKALACARNARVTAAAGGGQARTARPCAAGLGEALEPAAKQGMLVLDAERSAGQLGMLVLDKGFGAGQQSLPDVLPGTGAAELDMPKREPRTIGDGVYVSPAQPRPMKGAAPVAALEQGGASVNPGSHTEPWAPADASDATTSAAAEERSLASGEQRNTAHGGSSCSGTPTGCSQPLAAPASLGTETRDPAKLIRQSCSADSGSSSCSSVSTKPLQQVSALAAAGPLLGSGCPAKLTGQEQSS